MIHEIVNTNAALEDTRLGKCKSLLDNQTVTLIKCAQACPLGTSSKHFYAYHLFTS